MIFVPHDFETNFRFYWERLNTYLDFRCESYPKAYNTAELLFGLAGGLEGQENAFFEAFSCLPEREASPLLVWYPDQRYRDHHKEKA